MRTCGETVDEFVAQQQGWLPERHEHLVALVLRGLHASRTERVLFDRSAGVVGMLSARPVGSWAIREVGYWIGPNFRGRGYMAEALDGLIPWLFDDGADVLVARTALDNVSSRRILAGAGFIEVSESPHMLPSGVTVASVYYERSLRRVKPAHPDQSTPRSRCAPNGAAKADRVRADRRVGVLFD